MPRWIWQHPDWPAFRWGEKALIAPLSKARLKQGKLLGLRGLLDAGLSQEARAQVLVEECLNTSAIEGERFDLDAIRSSVARHLGLPAAGLPVPPRAVDGLIEVLLDATGGFDRPLTLKRLGGWQAALFPTGYSGLFEIRTGQLRGGDPMRVVSGGAGREKMHFQAPPRAGLDQELDRFLAWFLTEVSAACDQSEATVGCVIAKARFWLRHQNTELNERQRKALNRLLDAGAGGFEGGMNTRKYAGLNKTSRATAYRELADLVAKGCLAQVGDGRSTAYEIRWTPERNTPSEGKR